MALASWGGGGAKLPLGVSLLPVPVLDWCEPSQSLNQETFWIHFSEDCPHSCYVSAADRFPTPVKPRVFPVYLLFR